MKWMLLFLILSDSGLVTGWYKEFATEAQCKAAQAQAHRDAEQLYELSTRVRSACNAR